MNNEDVFEFGWEDEIENEGSDFVLLPEGDYEFCIKKIERARYAGSAKVRECNQAKITVTIFGAEDSVDIQENIFLLSSFEWKLSQFFLSIGLKKHGEKLRMNWTAAVGKRGKCHVYVDTYQKKDGSEGKSNKIKKFYAYDEEVATVTPAQQTVYAQPMQYTPPTSQPTVSGWKAGSF